MIQEIYIVETLQFKHFSYSFTPKTVEGGYHTSLERAREAIEALPPRIGLWALISKVPVDVLNGEALKEPVELYEYYATYQTYKRCEVAQTPVQRLIFKLLNIPQEVAPQPSRAQTANVSVVSVAHYCEVKQGIKSQH